MSCFRRFHVLGMALAALIGFSTSACADTVIDVWDSTDPGNYVLVGQIHTIQTAQSGAEHYRYSSASGHPSGVNLGPQSASIWMHENTGNSNLTFGFIFGQENTSPPNTAKVKFRIVDSADDPSVSLSDDPPETVETPAGSNAFLGTFVYKRNTDGIAVSGISGNQWTIIVDSVNFGNVTNWFAANGSGNANDLVLTLGHEYRLTPKGHQPSGAPVVLNRDPDCSAARPSIAELWPANHRMVSVNILGVTDPDAGDKVAITIDKITQDEPVNGAGDGDTAPDGAINGSRAQVRAERSGSGNGRVYTISFTASDGRGGTASGIVKVSVPHDQGKGKVAVDDGQTYSSLDSQ